MNKLFVVVLCSLAAVVSAGYSSRGGASSYGNSANGYGNTQAGISTGHSSQFRQDDHYGNYHFGYDESHATGATSRREEQQNGVRRGSYSLSDADGRMRTVNYIADDYGFRATVHTNEPGVEAKDPADVQIEKKQEVNSYSSYGANGANGGYGTSGAAAQTGHYASAMSNGAGHYAQQMTTAPVYVQMRSPARFATATALGSAGGYGSASASRSSYGSTGTQSYGGAQVNSYGAQARSYGGAQSGYGASAQSGYGNQHQAMYEAPAPRAFSYSFGTSHVAPMGGYTTVASTQYGSAPAPAIYHEQQQNLEY